MRPSYISSEEPEYGFISAIAIVGVKWTPWSPPWEAGRELRSGLLWQRGWRRNPGCVKESLGEGGTESGIDGGKLGEAERGGELPEVGWVAH